MIQIHGKSTKLAQKCGYAVAKRIRGRRPCLRSGPGMTGLSGDTLGVTNSIRNRRTESYTTMIGAWFQLGSGVNYILRGLLKCGAGWVDSTNDPREQPSHRHFINPKMLGKLRETL